MKGLLGVLLGEDPRQRYDPHKFTSSSSAPALPLQAAAAAPAAAPKASPPPRPRPPPAAPEPLRSLAAPQPLPPAPEAAPRLYGSGNQELANNPSAQSEPVPLGCWMVSQPGSLYPVRQQLKQDTIPLTARVQIAACNPPIGRRGTAALYEPESFMSPIETTQPVVATGSLINTYTGEVTDLFEDAMPPPDNGRDAGDAVRERRQAQRRLLAAEGNVNASHRKREQQDPIQPGDAGVSTQLANFQISADVATEWNERANRDLFFNRNELAPTELEMTRNPFGFEGYNNRLRVFPYLLPTQELDDKDWTANATLLPGGEQRPQKPSPKLRKDRPRTDYLGQISGQQPGADGRGPVRRSQAARDEEGLTQPGRCVNAQALYGEAAPVATGELRLSASDSRDAKGGAGRAGLAPQLQELGVVTAASLAATLRGGARGEAEALPLAHALDATACLGAGLGSAQKQAATPGQGARGQAEALPLAHALDATAGLGAGLAFSQKQTASARQEARTVDPASLFSSLTGAEAAGLARAQRQQLGARDASALLRTAAGAAAEEGAARPDVAAAEAPRGQQLQTDRRDGLRAPAGAGLAAAQGTEAAARRVQLDDHGKLVVLQGQLPPASGAHGAFGQLRLRDVRPEGAEERSLGRPHAETGAAERNSRVAASNARGRVLSGRVERQKVGGDVDFQRRADLAAREWKRELLARPEARRSAAAEGDRCSLAAASEPRRVRAAKSPFRAHPLREQGGISRLLPESLESRFEEA